MLAMNISSFFPKKYRCTVTVCFFIKIPNIQTRIVWRHCLYSSPSALVYTFMQFITFITFAIITQTYYFYSFLSRCSIYRFLLFHRLQLSHNLKYCISLNMRLLTFPSKWKLTITLLFILHYTFQDCFSLQQMSMFA